MLLKEGLVYMRIKSLTVLVTKMKRNDKCHFSPSDCKNNKKTCSVRELESQTFLHGPSKNIKGPSLSERHFYSLYIKASWKMLVWKKRQKRKEERDRTPIWPTGAGGGPRPEPGARSAECGLHLMSMARSQPLESAPSFLPASASVRPRGTRAWDLA